MPKIKKQKEDSAGGFGKNSESESSSITKLRVILDRKPIHPEIFENDKFPNIDGRLHLVKGEKRVPFAQLEAQIKTLDKKDWSRKGFSVERSFLTYCRNTAVLPVLLIGAHHSENKAFWVQVTKEAAENLLNSSDKATITVRFPSENEITPDTIDFSEWEKIALAPKDILDIVSALKIDQHKIKVHSDLINGIGSSIEYKFDSVNTQYFIDEYNRLFDVDFLSIKNKAYGEDCWKVGVGILNYEVNQISYALYLIQKGKHDLLVKELKRDSIPPEAKAEQRSYYTKNPIKDDPIYHARELVLKKVNKSIENGALDFSSKPLELEIIFKTLIDERFYYWLGLEAKDTYTAQELKDAINNFLPMYLYILYFCYIPREFEQVIQLQLKQTGAVEVESFEEYAKLAGTFNYENINKEVKIRLSRGEKAGLPFPIYSKKLNLKAFDFAIQALEDNKTVVSPYARPDITRATQSYYNWSFLTPDEILANVNSVYGNLQNSYDQTVKENFPKLIESLKFFNDFDLLICNITISRGDDFQEIFPQVEVIKAKLLDENSDLKNKVIVVDEISTPERIYISNDDFSGVLDGHKFKMLYSTSGSIDDSYITGFPLGVLIQEEICHRIEKYLIPIKNSGVNH